MNYGVKFRLVFTETRLTALIQEQNKLKIS